MSLPEKARVVEMRAGDDPQNEAGPVAAPFDTPASPCINVCRMNAASGLCEGCLRTLDEITCWSICEDDEKRAVLAQIPARRRTA